MSKDAAGPRQAPGSASDHAVRYEALRAYVVQCDVPASREGLIVLLRYGVAAWMSAWSRLPAAAEPPPLPPTQAERQLPPPLSDSASEELVHVLAAMTLGHIQEVNA